MAEVINFNDRRKTILEEKTQETVITEADTELEIIQIVGKETFIGMCDLLDEMGFEPYSNHQTLKDIESFSFVASALVSRHLKLNHPGTHMLDITGDLIAAMHSNANAQPMSLSLSIKEESDA